MFTMKQIGENLCKYNMKSYQRKKQEEKPKKKFFTIFLVLEKVFHNFYYYYIFLFAWKMVEVEKRGRKTLSSGGK